MDDMRGYIGTKLILAKLMTRGEYNEYRGWPVPEGEEAGDEGYLVQYEDGYQSWSPKDVFEKAYREYGGMTFGLALEAAKKGYKVARLGWNGKSQYVELATNISYVGADGTVENVNHAAIGNNALAFCGTSGVQIGWLASQADMLAEDWMIVGGEEEPK